MPAWDQGLPRLPVAASGLFCVGVRPLSRALPPPISAGEQTLRSQLAAVSQLSTGVEELSQVHLNVQAIRLALAEQKVGEVA